MKISEEACNRISLLIAEIEQLVRDETTGSPEPIQLPDDLRQRLLLLGSSPEDLTFWIRHDPEDPGVEWYELQEVESGVALHAISPREACDMYFSGASNPGGFTY